MTKNTRQEAPARLSDEQLRRSRAGRLGRFPSEDLYEPELTETPVDVRRTTTEHRVSRDNEKPRKRSAAGGLE